MKVFLLEQSERNYFFKYLRAFRIFCKKKTVLLALMQKSELQGIEVVKFSKKEQKYNDGHK